MNSNLKIEEFIQPLLWSYNIPANELSGYLTDKNFSHQTIDRKTIYREILKTYSWYTILENVDREILLEMLSDDVLAGLFPKSLVARYKYARRFLQ